MDVTKQFEPNGSSERREQQALNDQLKQQIRDARKQARRYTPPLLCVDPPMHLDTPPCEMAFPR